MFDLFIVVLGLTAISFLLVVISQYVYFFKYEFTGKNKDKKPKPEQRVLFSILCQFVMFGLFLVLALGITILLNTFGFTFI